MTPGNAESRVGDVTTDGTEPGGIDLRLGDSLAILRDLPDASVDALVTDPPYDRTASTRTKYVDSDALHDLKDFDGDNRDQRGYGYWCALWLAECLRIVKPGGVALLFTDWRQLPITSDALQAGGFVWRGLVPWAKTNARPMAGRFTSQCEYVIWGSRGSMGLDFADACLPGFYVANPPKDRQHITQKPLSVMRELVKIAPKGGTVLDPFMGSGTTGIATVLEGRRFVGIEMNEHYHRIASDRIATAQQGYRDDGLQGVKGRQRRRRRPQSAHRGIPTTRRTRGSTVALGSAVAARTTTRTVGMRSVVRLPRRHRDRSERFLGGTGRSAT